MERDDKIIQLINILQKGLHEKRDVFCLAVLTMLSGESLFLLGKPGVAKSLISRRMKFAIQDGTSFEYLMNRFSTPEEIFGPISIKELQEGKYIRLVDRYLPTSSIVFLDEIWKAGPSIQNTLLTIINEKLFRNGGEDMKVPLKLLISASNELPAEGQGLEALYDRFIMRYIVRGIQNENSFNEMINANIPIDIEVPEELQISDVEFKEWKKGIANVKMDQSTFNFIKRIKIKLAVLTQGKAYISDRRWKKIAGIMKASAFFNNRQVVDKPDWLAIKYCIWDDEEQEEVYGRIFQEIYIESLTYDLREEKAIIDQEFIQLNQIIKNFEDPQGHAVKNIYIDPNKLKGNFYRILTADKEYPIKYISIAEFDKLLHKKETVSLYIAKDLTSQPKIKKHKFKLIDQKNMILLDMGTEEKCPIELKDSNGVEGDITNIENKMQECENRLADINNRIFHEKDRLLSLQSIFFQNEYSLMVNNAFTDEE
ncbi:AAA family ATPase [Spiroplasma endosymbiont of Amphibalanus improvisus]|uniref:AAA family ATPase n=1 Tax=Spiroplasma endosymbiont of Amphibalanus improvisus TaxID=3066327 RepID=UPI00313B7532